MDWPPLEIKNGDSVLGEWIVHEDGSLSHPKCGMIRHYSHRDDGRHYCYSKDDFLAFVPIIVCELLKIRKSINQEKKDARRATGERSPRTY